MPPKFKDREQIVRAPLRVQVKTANYTVVPADAGSFFSTQGAAGAVTFTLPALSSVPIGWYADFHGAEVQDMTVQRAGSDTMIAFNNTAATSVAYDTPLEQGGGGFRIIKIDASNWYVIPYPGDNLQTITVT